VQICPSALTILRRKTALIVEFGVLNPNWSLTGWNTAFPTKIDQVTSLMVTEDATWASEEHRKCQELREIPWFLETVKSWICLREMLSLLLTVFTYLHQIFIYLPNKTIFPKFPYHVGFCPISPHALVSCQRILCPPRGGQLSWFSWDRTEGLRGHRTFCAKTRKSPGMLGHTGCPPCERHTELKSKIF
jgi:hypothetical protein